MQELKKVFDTLKNYHANQSANSIVSDFTKSELFKWNLLLVTGDSTYGLQFADIFLYLFAQKEKHNIDQFPKCSSFINVHFMSERQFEITKEQLLFEAKVYDYIINNKKLSAIELDRGRKMMKQIEELRWKEN